MIGFVFLTGMTIGMLIIAVVIRLTLNHAIKHNETWSDGMGHRYKIKKIY